MIARIAWWLFLAAVAAVAVFAQADRASERDPRFAPFVPGPFRSFAQVPMAMVATIVDGPVAAREEARTLVRRRPVPAEHLFALALADLRTGDREGYAAAFRLATTRGWRAAPVQAAAAQEAIAGGDFAGAANRVAALWAMNPNDPALGELTVQVLADPTGRAAFARNLALGENWHDAFARRARSLPQPDTARAAVAEAQRRGAGFDCAALEALALTCAAGG